MLSWLGFGYHQVQNVTYYVGVPLGRLSILFLKMLQFLRNLKEVFPSCKMLCCAQPVFEIRKIRKVLDGHGSCFNFRLSECLRCRPIEDLMKNMFTDNHKSEMRLVDHQLCWVSGLWTAGQLLISYDVHVFWKHRTTRRVPFLFNLVTNQYSIS